ncbi:MAG: SMP-30/gluconolactonase/LRE family protein [Chloroflexota bacterium]|nr:SMP-30/gluconolactonase/LRE family protein [Chloroflexota bacterium]MDQ5867451.1 SMP-30/gluconolactonase/LRE family protein [Chloroflexota bacterium]
MSEVEHVLDVQHKLGEGPRWNADEQALYWVDIENDSFYRYYPGDGTFEGFGVGMPVGALAFREAGGLVLAVRDGLALWDFNKSRLDFVADTELEKKESRFNDGAVDPEGRFWAGTMTHDGSASSSLYRLDSDYSVHTMATGLTISNGIGWSPDGKTMYHTDTEKQVIYAYDFDLATGNIENRRDFVRTSEEAGFPDGLTVDAEGFVWSAFYGGWRVVRYGPDGKREREVRLPVANVTACTFGGPDLTDLYITTAWSGLNDEQRREQPLAGDLFMLSTDIKGQPQAKFRG